MFSIQNFSKSLSLSQSWGFVKIDVKSSSLVPFSTLYPYSHLAKGGNDINMDSVLPFVCNPKIVPLSQTKLNSTYLPIIEKRAPKKYTSEEREFQLYRRGRYVEFNLVWDRGTIFGLQTNGRTESILMSLPPLARWEYGYKAEKGSREEFLTSIFTKPQDWLNDKDLEKFCMDNNIFD